MKVLLTGATGMVGRNLLESPRAVAHEWLTPARVDLDLTNVTAVFNYLKRHQPDCVIHAAGRVGGIQANLREPVRFLIENLDMGRNVLVACAMVGVKNVINLGSSCMYPKNRMDPLIESDVLTGELEPTNEGYALAKIATARLAEYLSRENPDLAYKSIIPCNLYGRHDKFDPQWSHMIPAVIHKLHRAKLNGWKSVEIWGDGSARREFMYASDLADAILLGVDNVFEMPALMNIGTGCDHSVNEYYEIAAQVVGYEGSFEHDLSKPVGMSRKLTSVALAKNWGWQARTSLKDGLAKTYEYYLNMTGDK